MRRIITAIDNVNEWVGGWIKLLPYVFVTIICLEVALRYVFNYPTVWLPVIVTMIAAAMYALSFGYVFLQDGHVRVDIFSRLLSRRGKAILEVVFGVLFFFPVIGSLAYSGALWMWFAWATDERSHQTYWYAPIGPIRTVVFIGLLLFLLQGLAIFVRNLEIIFGRKETP